MFSRDKELIASFRGPWWARVLLVLALASMNGCVALSLPLGCGAGFYQAHGHGVAESFWLSLKDMARDARRFVLTLEPLGGAQEEHDNEDGVVSKVPAIVAEGTRVRLV